MHFMLEVCMVCQNVFLSRVIHAAMNSTKYTKRKAHLQTRIHILLLKDEHPFDIL